MVPNSATWTCTKRAKWVSRKEHVELEMGGEYNCGNLLWQSCQTFYPSFLGRYRRRGSGCRVGSDVMKKRGTWKARCIIMRMALGVFVIARIGCSCLTGSAKSFDDYIGGTDRIYTLNINTMSNLHNVI